MYFKSQPKEDGNNKQMSNCGMCALTILLYFCLKLPFVNPIPSAG